MAAGIAGKIGFERNTGRRKPRWSVLPAIAAVSGRDSPTFPQEDPFDVSGVSMRSCRDDEAIVLCDGVIDIVAAFFQVPTRELRRCGRSSLEIAQIRQIAMYVAHVTLRLSMKQVGVGFSRDRTTVLHACHVVEDMRDDGELERIIGHVERIVCAAFHMHQVAR